MKEASAAPAEAQQDINVQYAQWLEQAARNVARDARRRAVAEVHDALLAARRGRAIGQGPGLARALEVVGGMLADLDRG